MKKQLLNVQEMTKKIGVNKYRVYEWIRENKIPYLKTVGGIRFDPDEIDEWLRRHRD